MWRPAREDIGLLIAGALPLLWALWEGSIPNSDDAIYADMGRTIWRTGDLVDLRWHGGPVFDKPPLALALIGLGGGLLGFSDLGVRLPGALCGLASLMLLPALAEALGLRRRCGFVAALLLLGSTTFLFHCRRVLLDPVFLLASLAFLLLWARAHAREGATARRRTALLAAAGVAFGCAILSKWVFALLPALAILAWHLTMRRRIALRPAFVCAAVAVAIAAPWHIAQTIRHGAEFWSAYAGYHVIERAGRSLVSPSEPLLYARTLAETDVVFLLACAVGVLGLLLPGGSKSARSRARSSAAPLVMAIAAFVPLQASGTRMPHYLLAVLPLLALGAAAGWEKLRERWHIPWLVLLVYFVAAFATGPLHHVLHPDYSPGSRAACDVAQREGANLRPPVVVANSYNVAVTWYCDYPVPTWTDDAHFDELVRSIDHLRRSGAVELLKPAELDRRLTAVADRPIVTRPGHGSVLQDRLRRSDLDLDIERHAEAELLLPRR
jgi:4-amino-4-deoxy-L-arabinose transferase-like glycosyltransferase